LYPILIGRRPLISGATAGERQAKLSPDDLARACAEAMWNEGRRQQGSRHGDPADQPGEATLTMTILRIW